MGKLIRRAELQDRYDGVLPWSVPRNVSISISDYQRQETILEWVVDNKDIYGKISPPIVWQKFLENVEKNHETPIEDLLDTFKREYQILCEIEGLTIDIHMMEFTTKQFLEDSGSSQPLFGWGNYDKLYEDMKTRLAELTEMNK